MKNKAAVPTFFVHNETPARKREKRKQKASREQQEWEHGKYENYWVSIVFVVFHMLRKCSGLSFYVSCFMSPVFCLHVFCWYVPCFIVFLQMLFPVQIFVNNSQTTTIVCHFADNSRTNTFTHVGDIVTATKKCGTLKVITF